MTANNESPRDRPKTDREIELERLELDYQHQQFRFMLWIILGAFLFGALVMIAAVGAPLFFLKDRPMSDIAQYNVAKDVLPYATGMIGFAGGLVSAYIGRRGGK